MTEEQSNFSGWAIVDVMGKQRYVGYVRTESYGAASLFRVDVPELPAREFVLEHPEYVGHTYAPKGTRVQREASPGYTKLIGVGSIYMISPCSEAAAMKAVELNQRAPMKVIELAPDGRSLPSPEDDSDQEEDDYEGMDQESEEV